MNIYSIVPWSFLKPWQIFFNPVQDGIKYLTSLLAKNNLEENQNSITITLQSLLTQFEPFIASLEGFENFYQQKLDSGNFSNDSKVNELAGRIKELMSTVAKFMNDATGLSEFLDDPGTLRKVLKILNLIGKSNKQRKEKIWMSDGDDHKI